MTSARSGEAGQIPALARSRRPAPSAGESDHRSRQEAVSASSRTTAPRSTMPLAPAAPCKQTLARAVSLAIARVVLALTGTAVAIATLTVVAIATLTVVAIVALTTLTAAPAFAAGSGRIPDLAKGAAYLTSPANLTDGEYYESFPRTADFGLTMDGAFALAAAGKDLKYLQKIISFIDHGEKDQSGRTVDDWTGIGTKSADGGAIAKEPLLAEVVGDNPSNF